MGMNIEKIRNDFQVLQKEIKGKPIVYLDNACMSLKPQQVIDAMNSYYYEFPACAGRSYHKLGQRATEAVEKARKTIRNFIGAKKEEELIFTRNTTEGINLVMNSLRFSKGDVVLSSDKEHNSILVPILMLAKRRSVTHGVVSTDTGFDLEEFKKKLTKQVKLVAVVHSSNLDGTTNPVKEIIKTAHDNGSLVLVDAAQSMPHKEVDVRKLDADFLAFSGHKMLGPTGTGALYVKNDLYDQMDPFMVGGDTVSETTYDKADFEKPPERYEAGLQDYAGMIGFAAAARYLEKIGKANIQKHEIELNKRITEALGDSEKLQLIGPKDPAQRSGIFSFNIKGMSPHEVAMILDSSANVMIRSGAHCVHSWFNKHDMDGSARASMYLYNNLADAESFIREINHLLKI